MKVTPPPLYNPTGKRLFKMPAYLTESGVPEFWFTYSGIRHFCGFYRRHAHLRMHHLRLDLDMFYQQACASEKMHQSKGRRPRA